MANGEIKYIWRCAKCSSHFSNITRSEGTIKQEKKCSRCKALNTLTLTDKELFIHCKFFDENTNCYGRELEETYPYDR